MNIREKINAAAAERILVLDGAMGSMIQAHRSPDNKPLAEADFRGEQFKSHGKKLLGCNDVLCLTGPDLISPIHDAYLGAGADIIETCSLNASSVGLQDYDLGSYARVISRAAASLARKAADKYTTPQKPRFVAGSIGNTAKSAVFTPDMDNPLNRQVTWDELEASYYENAAGLIEGGADFLLIETIYDGLNAKAALAAISRLEKELGRDIPAAVSATVTESGRLLTGQTPEDFCSAMMHANPLALGLNCSFGIEKLKPVLEKLSSFLTCPVIFYPNAGMPDAGGHYSDTPETMAAAAEVCMKNALVNIIGGCCGSTPAHIAAIAEKARRYKPRPFAVTGKSRAMISACDRVKNKITAWQPGIIVPWQDTLDKGDFEDAVEIARDNAEILYINTDKSPDPVSAMRGFLFLASAYSDLAPLPVLIESKSWVTIEEGLKCCHGRATVRYTGPADAAPQKNDEIYRLYGAVVCT